MYNCDKIQSIKIRYLDGSERALDKGEILSICSTANDQNISIEMLFKKIEKKEVRYVEINVPPYKPEAKDGKLLKPLPPY